MCQRFTCFNGSNSYMNTIFIKSMTLKLNNHDHMSLNSLLGYKIIPQTMYKNTVKPGIFCMSFCEDPLNDEFSHTSDIHFDRIDKADLHFEVYPETTMDKDFVLLILRREYNQFRFSNGYGGIVYE